MFVLSLCNNFRHLIQAFVSGLSRYVSCLNHSFQRVADPILTIPAGNRIVDWCLQEEVDQLVLGYLH